MAKLIGEHMEPGAFTGDPAGDWLRSRAPWLEVVTLGTERGVVTAVVVDGVYNADPASVSPEEHETRRVRFEQALRSALGGDPR